MVSWANTPRPGLIYQGSAVRMASRSNIPLHFIDRPVAPWFVDQQRALFAEAYPDLAPYYPMPHPDIEWSPGWLVGPVQGYWWI